MKIGMFANRRFTVLIGMLLFLTTVSTAMGPVSRAMPKAGGERFSNLQDNDQYELTVANWSFQVESAVKSRTFSDVIHLGALEDGRDWLAVTMTATNTSGETQEIHSDKVQLRTGDEMIKQTGAESEGAAEEIGIISIGGSSSQEVDAGAKLDVIQVYKVQPDDNDFELVFDFSGEWVIRITDLVTQSDGNPEALAGATGAVAPGSTPQTSVSTPWHIANSDFEVTLIGAASAQTFTGPLHLGSLDDGRDWLVVSYNVTNKASDNKEFKSDSVTILSAGETINQAGDETRSVASEIGMIAPSHELEGDAEGTFVQVFKIAPNEASNTLVIAGGGNWYINLEPVTEVADGSAEAIIPESSIDLASLNIQSDVAQAIPTVAPTPTPEPTPTPKPTDIPEPTDVPKVGSKDNPASISETLENGKFAVEISNVQTAASLNYGYVVPRGGFQYVIVTINITNFSDSGADYGIGDFTLINRESDQEYNSEVFNYADQPLQGGDLGLGEYTYGQIVFEVPYSANEVLLRFQPSIFSDGSYWTIVVS